MKPERLYPRFDFFFSAQIWIVTILLLLVLMSGQANAIMVTTACVDSEWLSVPENVLGTKQKIVTQFFDGSGKRCPSGTFGVIGGSNFNYKFTDRTGIFSWVLATVLTLCIFATMLGLGWLVRQRSIDVNNSRKILASGILILPFMFSYRVGGTSNQFAMLSGFIATIGCFAIFSEPFRSRIPILALGFASFDRPDDRPHTLLWILTSYVCCTAAILSMMFFASHNAKVLAVIVVFIVSLGDIVSGWVGFNFGRYHYPVPSLAKGRRYSRTIEGSAALFMTGILTMWLFAPTALPQLPLIAFFMLPATITLFEAFSPHTWDEPFMLFGGMIASLALAPLSALH
jgi:dolichol kinase